ncbi:hypothetical protein D3C74_247060 [compost metagenome]
MAEQQPEAESEPHEFGGSCEAGHPDAQQDRQPPGWHIFRVAACHANESGAVPRDEQDRDAQTEPGVLPVGEGPEQHDEEQDEGDQVLSPAQNCGGAEITRLVLRASPRRRGSAHGRKPTKTTDRAGAKII